MAIITVNKKGAFSSQSVNDDNNVYLQEGLTKREYFAGLAMQGMSNIVKLDIDTKGYRFTNTEMVASMSVAIADALLSELDKQIDNE
jgi:hypothetical protein